MALLAHVLTRLGPQNVALEINSLGCPACRPAFRQALIAHFAARRELLCEDCRRRLEKNPLRVLDCKSEGCREAAEGAPAIAGHYCPECAGHFRAVQEGLALVGVPFTVAPRLVRGLDYYVRTTFEAVTGDLGAQNAVAGGGRYDGLVAELGGPPQPGIGFAAGLERLALLIPAPPAPAAPRSTSPPWERRPGGRPSAWPPSLGGPGSGWSWRARRKASRPDAQGRQDERPQGAHPGRGRIGQGPRHLKDMAQGGQEEVALADLAGRLGVKGAEPACKRDS